MHVWQNLIILKIKNYELNNARENWYTPRSLDI